MKLQIMSDLHLEFSTFEPIKTDADIVVLAGDIGKVANGLIWARGAFPDKEIIYVPGNHELYGTQRLETLALLRIAAKECNVHFLDDDEVVIGGIRFLGSTLWTDFRLFGEKAKIAAMVAGQNGLNDFRVIHEGALGHFSPARSIELHEKSLAWLSGKLDEAYAGDTVVVTHHLPSARSVVERFKHDLLSACFASDLDLLFGKAALWIHGHTHDNLDYTVNGTRVICNPRGYVTYRGAENFNFNESLVVEI
ncbi:metallophosphoesterase [Sideroxydans sp. CL21]|uniref:metallophosphoesterase n=1 Tax=Sideroxydans sp. CL21 TaxID=2600596 RepID=UPI0012A9FFE3|nr:metallophosphoesterase [Sideroxydans sp. CL21]VVC82478.1 Ser/Thr protein phosphatase family protein [Sideroxydans sp. CL21]